MRLSKATLSSIVLTVIFSMSFIHFSTPPPVESTQQNEHSIPMHDNSDPKTANQISNKRSPSTESHSFEEKLVAAQLKLSELEQCYESQSCPFPQRDPREYELSIGQAIQEELHLLLKHIDKENVASEPVSKIGRHFLSNPDGHVKEAALALLATQPPSSENLQVLLEDGLHSYNSVLVPQLIMELQKYKQPSDLDQIDLMIAEILKSGSLMVRQRLVKQILPLLNQRNIEKFAALALQLPQGSSIQKDLLANIQEFRRQHRGG